MKCCARAVFCCVIWVALAAPLHGAKHPVPLDKNTDVAKCIECHDEKAKGKFVHSAISTGCYSCHELRVNNDVTRIKLTETTVQGLCVNCHPNKNAETLRGRVHNPAIRDCETCHDAHSSAHKNNLLKGTSGDSKNENLCLGCHKVGLNVPKGGSRHAALDAGCDACHKTHKVGDPNQREFAYHLTKAVPDLCVDCHDTNDAKLKSVHNNQPFEKADCLTCHDPHQSKSPKLLQKFVHSPFGDKDSCSTCHVAAKEGKVVLTQSNAKALCLMCHDEQEKKIANAKVHHAGADGDCTDCHNAHAGKTPGFPKPDAVNACLACHPDQAEQHKKAHLHQPAFEQGCSTCHEPHGGSNAKLLRATGNALCIECHGPKVNAVPLEKEHVVTIFSGKVKLPEDYFANVVALPIKYGLGHPTAGHPVEDRMDPTDSSKVTVRIGCMNCHQPHASTQKFLLINDQANKMAFCDTCHKDRTMRTVTVGGK